MRRGAKSYSKGRARESLVVAASGAQPVSENEWESESPQLAAPYRERYGPATRLIAERISKSPTAYNVNEKGGGVSIDDLKRAPFWLSNTKLIRTKFRCYIFGRARRETVTDEQWTFIEPLIPELPRREDGGVTVRG